ncbi:MAG: sigma-70 family RNA polymerase sigma factor [Eubacterium sp.]|nr:sigma-70 family RNA polymerase sigma factor [Eubacterium sp.]
MVKTTIEYDDDCIEIDVSKEVYEYLEQDRRRQQAQDRSDRRHLSKGTFEQDYIGSQRVSIYTDGTYLEVVHKMELEKLRSALRMLSSDEQALIELYYYRNLSMEKIGQYFGISRMAVSKRHNRIIKKLRELMATWVPFFYAKNIFAN